jgi:branched-chain amino acid transport system ATP-binding protein
MLLQIKKINVNYGGIQALLGVSLDVQPGQIMCILGGNGAGKTTMVNTICGFVIPASGEIWFKGEKINGISPHLTVKLGIVQVPEGRGIFSTLSVLENLRIGAYLVKSKERMGKNLEHIEEIFPVLKERKYQTAGSLSGGEQQMLAIGRALMSSPQLLLMDEPTLGLSPLIRNEVARVTKQINQGGTTIILVEQNAHMSLRISHMGIVLQNGQVAMQGTSNELLNNPLLRESYLS